MIPKRIKYKGQIYEAVESKKLKEADEWSDIDDDYYGDGSNNRYLKFYPYDILVYDDKRREVKSKNKYSLRKEEALKIAKELSLNNSSRYYIVIDGNDYDDSDSIKAIFKNGNMLKSVALEEFESGCSINEAKVNHYDYIQYVFRKNKKIFDELVASGKEYIDDDFGFDGDDIRAIMNDVTLKLIDEFSNKK